MSHQLSLQTLIDKLADHSGIRLKQDIAAVSRHLSALPDNWLSNGDDTAAIPLGKENGWQLLAVEGMQPEFVHADPWFAGWCSLLVNCSDIAAMGGRPTAVVDALWCDGNPETLKAMVCGMRDASEHLGVPIVGGHTNLTSHNANLAVAILGHAQRLLRSDAARPDQWLVAAIDQRGKFQGKSLNWNAATNAPAARLRDDLALLPSIAERELAYACKDISQAGLLGTTVMMLEKSHCGATIDLDAIPIPNGVELTDWLCAFPSFGYLLTATDHQLAALIDTFQQRDIDAAVIGRMNTSRRLTLRQGDSEQVFYDLNNNTLTGFS